MGQTTVQIIECALVTANERVARSVRFNVPVCHTLKQLYYNVE